MMRDAEKGPLCYIEHQSLAQSAHTVSLARGVSVYLLFSIHVVCKWATKMSIRICEGVVHLCVKISFNINPSLAEHDMPCLSKQCRSREEANWSGSALFVIKYVNFYQKRESSNLIGWKLEVGVASQFIQQGKG